MSEQADDNPVVKNRLPRILLVSGLVCLALVITVGAWLYVKAQRDTKDWVEDTWDRIGQGEPSPGPGQSGQDPIIARKATLAELPEVPMASQAAGVSAAEENRRVQVANGSFSMIPPLGWTIEDLGAGVPPFYKSPEGDTLEVGPFPINETDPFARAEELAPALLGTPTVLEKGAVTLETGRAAVYVAKGKPDSGDVMQMMHCVIYGDRRAVTMILYASEASFAKSRVAMEKVMRSIRENGRPN